MFEAHVLHLLQKYLGEYVHGLSAEALRISVWKGDVVLKDLKLKAEALNSLRLPVTVKAGFIGTITLKVPWKGLGKEPVIVLIDRVFILAHPAPYGWDLKEEDRERLLEAKLRQIEELEASTIEAMSRSKQGSVPAGNSWLGSLIATIIGNLKVSISNIHIRYEDSLSNPGHPFSCGISLAKLAAVTMDEQGNETFDTSGALDKLRKSLQLERLAIYHDSNRPPWKIDKKWEAVGPSEWVEIFEEGINEPVTDTKVESCWAFNRTYLVSPINGILKYHRLGCQERNSAEVPFEKASVVLDDVRLTITEAQYYDWIKLLEVISRYRIQLEVSHLRPKVPIAERPHLWWHFAAQAALQQRKTNRFSWEQIIRLCTLRKRYIQLYVGTLQRTSDIDNQELRRIERDLDAKVILLWRLLAHAKVESAKSKEAALQRQHSRSSWFSLRWASPVEGSENYSDADSSESSLSTEEKLTKEEWQAINNLLSYQPEEEMSFRSGKDSKSMIKFLIDVAICQAAAKIIDINETEVVCGRFEQLYVSVKLKHSSTHCDVSLRYYGLSAPEGSLAQSVCDEQKENALAASFVQSPVGENVDWRLSATMCPVHVTFLVESFDRLMKFMRRSNAVSPTVAMETATALQMKFEKVTRRAQEQFQMVLEEQSRFALDIDFDAPKVRVPIRACAASKCDSHFLLDFGHFTLRTKEGLPDEENQSLYSRFYISGRDIAAFFTDCGSGSQGCSLIMPPGDSMSSTSLTDDVDSFCPLVDRCGMAVVFDQIKVPHPKYPSTRVSVQVPSLGIHMSPERYSRLLNLVNILCNTMQSSTQAPGADSQPFLAPWFPADLAIEARILVWKGIGHTLATWQPCFLVLSGLYLYVLESDNAQSYQRSLSMAGKHVSEVPPASVGGSALCLSVCLRGMDFHKALESSSTLIMEFQDEDDKSMCLKGLTKATYQASAPFSMDMVGESHDDMNEFSEARLSNLKPADLVINGTLTESKFFMYGKLGDEEQENLKETLIAEVLAGGGKVHVVRSQGDLMVKMKVHFLRIKDELQSVSTETSQYLLYSVVKNDQTLASPCSLGSEAKEFASVFGDEEDIFTDALQDFIPVSDSNVHSDSLDYMDVDSSDKGSERVRGSPSETFYEALGTDDSDFVTVIFIIRDPCSLDYDGIDTQVSICMSTLEFFVNRPTVVALIGLGLDMSSANSQVSENAATTDPVNELTPKREKMVDGDAYVKGLLGYGKARVVFNLSMKVDSVTIFLNKEDGSQLAMFIQERFVMDLKVHPCSMSIESTLGNLRLCDKSLGDEHCWCWLCDIRNPGVESLIKLTFNSYSRDDEDYEGYDYSLRGRLSAVRIVFLYRFVQEFSAYFIGLATPQTEEVIKLVDKVGLEWFVEKYEMEGASSIKLDLSFDTPIIVIPKDSRSKDFIQLDLGMLEVKNELIWHGCPDNDPSAVHLDILRAEIQGINMAVGIDGVLGKPMIHEGHGFVISVCRSLRDVFKKVPTLSMEVQMELLHIFMLDKEYHVILDCAITNLNEEPRLPPSFRSAKPGSEDSVKLLVDKVNTNSQNLLSQTVTIAAVRINHLLLELCNSANEGSRLAQITLEELWVSYRMTSLSEADLYVTVPKFSILDVRQEAKPEMRLMLGPSADVYRPSGGGLSFSASSANLLRSHSAAFSGVDIPTSTMLLFDYRWRASSQSSVVRIQQPRVLVVPDFLLGVVEFFVPALGTITGREELMNPKNDPVCKNYSVVLSTPIYKQQEDIVELSPTRQLIADHHGVDEYVYDGCGKTLCLREQADGGESQSLSSQPIIVIGRGKRLRFVNVKIENGYLLRKYTYLSNDSSYSTFPEDDVDVVLLDKISSDDDNKSLDYIKDISDTSDAASCPDGELRRTQSLTFEAQVVSPEFTFYDGTKSSQADSLHGEKLLRAKLDLSLMYASKEDDTWVRALIKDLSIEAGSGLVILDPVDISGGYTSVKDKINMSLISTDVHFHLSLSVISLLLNLQSQVAAALQYGDSNPLAPCINYERIWVSPTENGSHYNLTFWRPRAPSNYVILGDCVTSRPIPPSQAYMSMSNAYGRVRKPLSFSLLGSLSSIEGVGNQSSMDTNVECSLWFPVAPPGYKAVGCVANIGSQPPPTHIVYCVREDLLTSTTYSGCIYSTPSSSHMASGFSIWRLDNSLGSFYAHPSVDHPSSEICYDLVQSLLWNTNWHLSSSGRIKADSTFDNQGLNNLSAGSSGWDIVRSYSRANNSCISTPNFERIWWDKGGELRRPVSVWRPIARPGYSVLGDCIIEGLEPPSLGIIFLADNPEVSAKPAQFTKVAQIIVKGVDEAFFWYPIAPPGYASIGCVVTRTDEPPRVDAFCCPRMDLVSPANILEVPISRSLNSKASHCWSIWKVENQGNTFLARPDLKKPSNRLAFAIGDFVKPKTRENVTADMKLRCFSVTVLDSLCGMMTPLFDMTIANIKLATHGRWEAMNAVLVSSMAASTFNPQLESWEPLVEPFDGIFKFETYETNVHPTPGLGKRVRIAATNVLNINISAANLETFAEAMLSWRRQKEFEQKSAKINEEDGVNQGNESTLSALDEDDFQTIIIENKLGCDIYLKTFEHNSENVELLLPDDSTPTWVPPPRFSVRLNHADESREARYYVAVNIIEAKGVPIIDDGNGYNLFCALRLVVDNQPTDQQKLFPQSARTKCVRPLVKKAGNADVGTAKWSELFIFEVPRKGVAKLEVELTNLAAKAGKGEVVGSSCFPVGHGTNTLRKLASSRMLHQQDFKNIASYPLKKKDQVNSDESLDNFGYLQACTSYFERTKSVKLQKETVKEDDGEPDVGFWVAVSPEGPWESTRSLLPLSVVPKYIGRDLVAMEVVMRNGKKHAVFRGLATIINDTDVKLDIATCPMSVLDIRSDKRMMNVVTLHPGTTSALPWQSMSRDSDRCLQIRPTVDSPDSPYSWGLTAAVGYLEQSLLSRQSTMKQGNRMASSALKLDELDKKDVLLSCSPVNGNKQFWLSAGTDASVLHTELNVPVYDWKISINAPLKLENRLPCPAEFTIWERSREGKGIERQQGIILSRKSANIYTADIQKPIYMSMFVQGGWVLEKDPVVILDLSSNDHVSSFWMVHQKTRRRLRVSIERDMGSTTVGPKVVRFFVPYWIINDSSMPLSYRVVEIEPLDNADADNLVFSRTKSAKMSTIPRKNVQVLDTIEDTSPSPSMLSPQDYVGRGGVMLFTSRNDAYLSPKVGISVAVRRSDFYSPGISLLELEKKGRVDVHAFNTDGSYYKLSAQLNMTSDRTKVVHFQPHTLYINRVGLRLCLQQCGTELMECIQPTDPPQLFRWQSSSKVEMMKLSLDGCRWSKPFSVGAEGFMRISLDDQGDSNIADISVTVRSGTKSSRYEVIFRPKSFFSPYRIENRSMILPIRFRQAGGSNDSWRLLPPSAAASFFWEDIGRERLLEILVDGSDPTRSVKYNIDEIVDHKPIDVGNGPASALRVTIIKEEKMNIVKITDWMPDDQVLPVIPGKVPSSLTPNPTSDSQSLQSPSSDTEFHVIVELSELGLSIIDHTPEEILYFSVQNLLMSHSTGLGSGISRFKLRMFGIQLDNQLPLSPMPVLFRPQRLKDENDYILKASVTSQSDGSLDLCAYPYIGFQILENSSFLINIHEPIIWRLHEMIQQVNLSRLYDTKTNAVSIDPIIEIGVLNISEVRLKVSMTMSPTQRPKGVLGFWSSLMTALGNMENMNVRIHQRFVEKVSMRQSVIISNATSNIQKDLLSQPLQLLSGVDILGNASSALGHMSKGVAALSMDKKFIQSRMRQESKGVEDFGDVIREGGGALAKGFFRGVTGILTKPLEGAKASGVEGFVQGVGKGIIGAAAQPVSGVLDLLSKTTEGANAMRMKILSALTSEEQLLRRRLPRVISADNLLRPYDEYKARGQVMLQLAESGAFFGQVDLFKVRGKFALSDAYEDHFMLPKGRFLIVTHRRAILLQQPSSISQKKFSPAKDPCSIVWDVLWDDLATMELAHGKKDSPNTPPSHLVLYLQTRSAEQKDAYRAVKCTPESHQAVEVYNAIDHAMSTYGPNQFKGSLKGKVTRPYSPLADQAGGESATKEGFSMMSPSQDPSTVPSRSTFGSNSG